MADTRNNKTSNSPAERTQGNAPALRFPGFTEPWKKTTLGECCGEMDYGMNAPAKEYDGDNKYIRITDIDENSSDYCCENIVSPDGVLSDKYLVNENDILFARTGSSTGKTYLYRPSDGHLYFASFLIRANVKDDNDSNFIYYQCKLKRYWNWVRIMSARSGQLGINSQEYSTYTIYSASKEEQSKISSFFRLLDERIAIQRRLIDKLETLIKGIVVSHFNSCNTKRTIAIKNLGEAYSVGNLSKDDLSESGKPCIVYGELFTTYGCVARKIQSRTDKYTQATLSKAGDLLFPASTTVDAISLIAPTSLQTDGVYVAGDMFGIHILPQYNSEYISYMLNYVYNKALSKYAQGSTIIHLHYTDIKNTDIQVPCLEEQNKCAALLEALQTKLDVAKQLIDCYQIQKSYLLRQMFK